MEIRRKIEEKASSHPFGPVITGKKTKESNALYIEYH
jgi:hypothetical protein